ncbi:MaoC/PaaZ C-terminal domain-containing protein [Thermodesulfobacteriota bacterium]
MPVSNYKLFTSMLKNINSTRLNRDLIGYSQDTPLVPVSINDILAYASATKDVNPTYQINEIAPPLFLSKLIIPSMKSLWCHNSLHLNLLRMVYAQQEIIWHQPIHIGDALTLKMIIRDISDTPAGEMIVVAGQCFNREILLVEGITSMIVRKKKKRSKRKLKKAAPLKEKFRVAIQTDEGQQLTYVKASGDNNFIHTSHFLSKLAGLPRTILHGSCALSMYCSALSQKIVKNDISRLAGINGRFARPVFPGDKLILVGYESLNTDEVPFEVFSPTGAKVFTHGLLTIKP